MTKKSPFIVLVLVALAAALPVFGQSITDDITSPRALAAGPSSRLVEAGSAEALNPAVTGGLQRTTLDVSYFSLLGSSTAPGTGHAANLGLALPYPFGVISGGARFLSSSIPGYQYGTLGGLRASFAKDLYPNLYIGLGLSSLFGQDFAMWGALGAFYTPGPLWFLREFSAGFTLDGIGNRYTYPSRARSFGVTPRLSVGGTFLDTDPADITGSLFLDAPGFTDLRVGVGVGATLFDLVRVSGSYRFELVPTRNDTARPAPVSVGIDVKLNLADRGEPQESENP